MKKISSICLILIVLVLLIGIECSPVYGEEVPPIQAPEEEMPKEPPAVKGKYPQSQNGRPWYNEKSLTHAVRDRITEGKYFVKVIFEDVDGKLELSGLENFKNCVVHPINGSGNVVDIDFINDIANMPDAKAAIGKYLFIKQGTQATLYIPVQPLRSQVTYHVNISSNIVCYTDVPEKGNDVVEWNFVTTATPLVTGVTMGSLPQNYDKDEPLYLYGDFFDSDSVSVYFNDIEADYVEVISDKELKVYLPEGRNLLQPGIYDVIVQNDIDHKQVLYGSLSIVESGEYIPNEHYRIKDEFVGGEVRSDVNVSEDTLMLDSYYSNERHLIFNLDQLVGDDALVRKIQYFGQRDESIDILETKSRWGDITLYEVTLEPYTDDDEITIYLGRAEPAVAQTLKQKLLGRVVKSDFIQVSGENYQTSGIRLNIPLKDYTGRKVRLLRYDEDTRNFYPQSFALNLIDNRVEAFSPYKGIFVVVEE